MANRASRLSRATAVVLAAAASVAGAQSPVHSVEIWSEDPIAIDIEWLTIDAAGNEAISATRKTAVAAPVPLEFSHAPDRYVRFSYQGASPRTYATSELVTARRLRVPDVLPGGELLLLFPRAPVRPAQYVIEGPRPTTVDVGNRVHASLPGMTAGDYKIIPVYEGGIRGEPQAATVAAARSTITAMPVEAVGAVRVLASHDACNGATEAGINRLVVPDVGPQFRIRNPTRVASAKDPRCDMTFAGLKPGAFEAYFQRDRTRTGTAEFEVAAQAWTNASIADMTVSVEGRVTMNGRPLPNAVVTFLPVGEKAADGGAPADTATDAAGFYRLPLAAPGRYQLMMARTRIPTDVRRQADFVEGRNFFDIALTGGTIRITIEGADAQTLVQIRVKGPTFTGSSAMNGRNARPVFEGLPFGEYAVSVTTGSHLLRDDLSDARRVTLSPESPEAALTFVLPKR